MAYRLTGVTLFNGDEFDHQDWSQYDVDDILEGPKDAGIRFDTFALGTFFFPLHSARFDFEHRILPLFLRCGELTRRVTFFFNCGLIDIGRYYEPYYIMLRTTPIGTRNNPQNLDDDEEPQLDIKKTFEIVKHTIPHWIPLRELEKRYLNRDMSVSILFFRSNPWRKSIA